MKTIFTYATPRPFGQFSMPVPAQNACMREYAQKRNYRYSLPPLELMYDNCYAQLFRLINEVPAEANICAYSVLMLPIFSSYKLQIIRELFVQKKIVFHFVLENKIINNWKSMEQLIIGYKIGDLISNESDVMSCMHRINKVIAN